jgi:hypothetical protein
MVMQTHSNGDAVPRKVKLSQSMTSSDSYQLHQTGSSIKAYKLYMSQPLRRERDCFVKHSQGGNAYFRRICSLFISSVQTNS